MDQRLYTHIQELTAPEWSKIAMGEPACQLEGKLSILVITKKPNNKENGINKKLATMSLTTPLLQSISKVISISRELYQDKQKLILRLRCIEMRL